MMGLGRSLAGARNVAFMEVAHRLRANGYSPVPLADKAPTINGWPAIFCERLPSVDEIEHEWSLALRGSHEMNGVGVAPADGLIIVDLDDDAAVERVLAILPQARNAPACVGQRGRKVFVRAEDGRNVREHDIMGATTGGALEVLAWHRQGVVPPTVHPKTGEPYTWIDERVTLLTVPIGNLPTICDADIDALRAAFAATSQQTVGRKKGTPQRPRESSAEVLDNVPVDVPPPRWWEASANRAKIEELIRLFGIVHRAARDRGGRITLQVDGLDAAGMPHRAETIDIDDTQHWKHVVRIIVDVLGPTLEAYRLHVEVSRGNATLDLPGGPRTYEAVGNRAFFDTVVGARGFEARSGKRPRTERSLRWWARVVEGRPPTPQRERRKSLVAAFHGNVARLHASGIEPNVTAARRQAVLLMRAGSKRLAIVHEALDFIEKGGGTAWMVDIAGVAADHGVSVRAVQNAISAAEAGGILVRTRGNEGGKHILLTVPAVVQAEAGSNILNREGSPSLLSGDAVCGAGLEVAERADATNASPAKHDESDDAWLEWDEEDDAPPFAPYGVVRRPGSEADQHAFDELLGEARRGQCIEETLLLAEILPAEASDIMLRIIEQNRAGKKAGAKWLRHIAGEIGELVLREPERWPWRLQVALDYVADRMERTKGRATPAKWVGIFAQNLGFLHERAGRLTPMGRAAVAARLRLGKSEHSDDQGKEAE